MIRKILPFLAIGLIGLLANAQNKIAFTDVKATNNRLAEKFKSYKILELDDNLQQVSDGQKITIHLDRDYAFTLRENRILAKNYSVLIKGKNGTSRKTLDEIGFNGQYFLNEGISADNRFAFSIFEDRYSIYVKSGTKEFYIEPLSNTDKLAAHNQYVYYEAKDIIQDGNFGCGTKDEKPLAATEAYERNSAVNGCKTIGLDIMVDYAMFATYGTINGAINRTLEIVNLSQANFTIANGLSDEVSFKAVEHCIVTCDVCNAWPLTPQIEENFDFFRYSFLYQFFNDPQDRIHVYFQNEGGTGTVAGIATAYNCSIYGSMIVKNYAANSDLTRNIFSHEMGHNLHCNHTAGFIMNAAVNGATTWAPESITAINNTVNTLTCIADCTSLPCDGKKVSGITALVNTVTDQVTISWLSEPGMTYKVKLFNLSNPMVWPEYTILSYPANSITYPISQIYCNDRYRFVIVPQCSDSDGIVANVLFKVSQDVAAPALINWTGFTDYFSGPIYPYSVLCSGKMYSCSLTGVDGGTAPVYQWKVNGANVGTNSNTLMIDTLQDNDILSCELTSNATCVATPTAFFSTTAHVVDPIPLAITLENVTSTTVCAGQSVKIKQFVDVNADYYQLGGQTNVTLESYFNGNPIDLYLVDFNFINDNESRIFEFTPTESGNFETQIHLGTSLDGSIPDCYLNQDAYSIPVYITVVPQPCSLGVSGVDISGLQYYPNPVNSILTIEAQEVITDVTIYTVLGQMLETKAINSSSATLDLSAFAKGPYFLKIHANDKVRNIKIIKD